MPAKYHIHMRRAPPRFTPLAKSTVLDWVWADSAAAAASKEVCPVDAYRKRGFDGSSWWTPSMISAATVTAASRVVPGDWSSRP